MGHGSVSIIRRNPAGVFTPGVYTQSVGVAVGTLIVVSGQVAFDAEGNLVGGDDITAQTHQVFHNLQTILAAWGLDFKQVIKLTLYVVHLQPDHRSAILEVMMQYLDPAHLPANTLIGVEALARPGLLIEVEAVAVTSVVVTGTGTG